MCALAHALIHFFPLCFSIILFSSIAINEKGSNLQSLLKRSNAAVRAGRRSSVVAVTKQVRKVKINHLKQEEIEELKRE